MNKIRKEDYEIIIGKHVTYCYECVYYMQDKIHLNCKLLAENRNPTDFCSRAERKETE